MDHPTGIYRERNINDNDLNNHLTNPHRGKNEDSNGLTDPSDTANSYPSYLLIVLQKIDR